MKCCPTCKASYKGHNICHRCKSDFTPLLSIEKEASYCFEKAKSLIKECKYDKALDWINKSLFLLKTQEAAALKTYVLAQHGEFKEVFSILETNQQITRN
jgi:hypothetical protein